MNDADALVVLSPVATRRRRLLGIADFISRALRLVCRGGGVWPPRKVLVFVPGRLGDMVFALPFSTTLRRAFPDVVITFAGAAELEGFVLGQGMADEYVPLAAPWRKYGSFEKRHNPFSLDWLRFALAVWNLRKWDFDLGFVLGSTDLRGNVVLALSGARRRVGYGYAGGAHLLTDIVEPDLQRTHFADRNLRLIEHLGLGVVRDVRLRVRNEDMEEAGRLLREKGVESGDVLIGIHPGAGTGVREWGEDRFAVVADWVIQKYGAKILWFLDPTAPRTAPDLRNLTPLALPLGQFLAAVSQCRLFIGNDSGPMHVAAALGIPVVAVFGPQRPEWTGPRGEGHRVVIRQDIWCRPCADHCRWREPYCLRLIPVEAVTEAVDAVMAHIQAGIGKAGMRSGSPVHIVGKNEIR